MRKIFGYFKTEKIRVIVFLIVSCISTVLNVLEPKITSGLVAALTEQDFKAMGCLAIAIAAVAIMAAVMRCIGTLISISVKVNVSKTLSSDLCKKALDIKGKNLQEFESGELTSICKDNPAELMDKLHNVIMYAFITTSSIAIATYVAYLNIWCFLLYVTFFCVVYFVQNNSLSEEQKKATKGRKESDSAKSIINQIFKGIMDIKVLNLKDIIFDRYQYFLKKEVLSQKTKIEARSKNRLFCDTAFEVYTFIFFIMGIMLMYLRKMSVTTFITIYLYRSTMYALVFNVSEIRSELKEINVLNNRIQKVLSIDKNKIESFGNIEGTNMEEHTINFSNVYFSYGNGDVLKNITTTIKQGEIVGIVGESGSGKTTMIKLLSRLIEPVKGSIKVDGVDISDYSEKGYTDIVSLASQQPYVFAFSIRENLLMVKQSATESEMWKALECAKIVNFVRSLPQGLDTRITESLNLSGGELQRLSLARLFLKNTPIMLFDEATSALDNRKQTEIMNIIREYAKNHMIVIVAHRIEVIKECDRILFMSDGVIADIGKHEELIKRNKEYAKIVAEK